MPHRARTYRLTPDLVAAYAGGPVVCLDIGAIGRTYRLHTTRPSPSRNRPLTRRAEAGLQPITTAPAEGIEPLPLVIRVDMRGPLEQRAGYHDVCGGWTDGYDAITERMTTALEAGDVLLVADSPGGACAGIVEAVRRIQAVKAQHGRRITGFVDECAGSAAYWLLAALCDEIFVPSQGMVGSIGARSAWYGCAGALAKDGLEVEYFAFPPGKIAFAPERPLSDAGRERGQRDVMLAFELFAAAVSAARGLSRDAIVGLDADMLTGEAAVAAGLVDGVETLESVVTYTLAMAAGAEDRMGAKGEDTEREDMPADAEGEAGESEEYEEKETRTVRRTRKAAPPADAEGEAQEDDEDEEEGPPSSVPPSARHRGAPTSLAAIAGLPAGSSDLAIRSELARLANVARHAQRVAGVDTLAAVPGALDAIATDAKNTGRMRAERDAAAKRANGMERMDLLRKLEASGRHSRGELFADHVDPVTGVRTVRPAELWGPSSKGRSLANLRGYVETALRSPSPTPRRDPFQPREAAAVPGASGGSVVVTEEHRALARRLGKDPEQVARSWAAIDQQIQRGAVGAGGM